MNTALNTERFVERAEALAPLIAAHADQAERERHLPAAVAEAFAREGLYRVGAPVEFHGAEADPMTQIRVIEAVSRVDGSAGWNLMIGIETFGIISVGFHKCPSLIADPMTVMASSTAAVGKAERIPEGWLVNGRWQFASGVHNAHIFGATVRLYEDGEQIDPINRYAIVPSEQIEILDTWHVAGLRGSGSHDVRLTDVVVPEEHIISAMGGTRSGSPLLHIPLGTRLAYNKVAVALGVARAGIDTFVEVATEKHPRFSDRKIRERPFVQRALANAEARLRGVRASVFDIVETVWDRVVAGEEVPMRERALLQIVCSDAVRTASDAVDTVVEAAGTTANKLGHPLERIARDVRVVRQHFTVAPHHIEDAGRVLLGLEPEGLMLRIR